MAYDANKLTKLSALKELAKKVEADYATKTSVTNLENRINDIVATGGEPNTINKIKVNGAEQAITDKAVNITVPTKVSQLTNDSTYQTNAQVASAIQTAISKAGHASFKKVDALPAATAAEENVLYLVMNKTSNHYDIYAKIGEKMELLDDTTVDLSGYVVKESGKGLSTNDYTTAEKTKLAGIAEGANKYTHPAYTAKASGLYKVTVDATGHVSAVAAVTKGDITALGIPAQDTTYSAATTSAAGLMSAADKAKLDGMNIAGDSEVTEMLTEVFGS